MDLTPRDYGNELMDEDVFKSLFSDKMKKKMDDAMDALYATTHLMAMEEVDRATRDLYCGHNFNHTPEMDYSRGYGDTARPFKLEKIRDKTLFMEYTPCSEIEYPYSFPDKENLKKFQNNLDPERYPPQHEVSLRDKSHQAQKQNTNNMSEQKDTRRPVSIEISAAAYDKLKEAKEAEIKEILQARFNEKAEKLGDIVADYPIGTEFTYLGKSFVVVSYGTSYVEASLTEEERVKLGVGLTEDDNYNIRGYGNNSIEKNVKSSVYAEYADKDGDIRTKEFSRALIATAVS